MSRLTDSADTRRRRFGPLILLAILLLAVAGAYLLTIGPQRQISAASAVLADVRQSGLATYWGEGGRQYFLAERAGRLVGWRAIERWRLDDGRYQGVEVAVVDREGLWEAWQLSGDAAAGVYQAGRLGRGLTGLRTLRDTVIEYRQGQVFHSAARGPAPAPAHYIPEGMLDLAMYLTARAGRDARFRVLPNAQPQGIDRPRFSLLRVRVQAGAEPSALASLPGDLPDLQYVFSPDGRIRRIVNGPVTYTAATPQQVLEVFPDAAILGELGSLIAPADQALPPAVIPFGTGDTDDD